MKLKWLTKTEVNNYGFNVERRINEGEWNSIAFIEGHGTQTHPKNTAIVIKIFSQEEASFSIG